MVITFKHKNTKRHCEDITICINKYGEEVAFMIFQKLSQIKATENIQSLAVHPLLDIKPIEKNILSLYTVELMQGKSLTFSVYKTEEIDGTVVEGVEIIEIK